MNLNAIHEIQQEEDKEFFEAIDRLFECDDDGSGICRRCFLPVKKVCPILDIENIMAS